MLYNYISKNPHLFPAVIGITEKQFYKLLKHFKKELANYEYESAYSKNRIRSIGGGRKSKLSTPEEKLLFILFYYKVYPTYRLAEIFFEMDHTNIYRWKVKLENTLQRCISFELELRTVQARTVNDVIEVCPQLSEILIDATERPIRRPKYNQEMYYSGKKKDHTVKTQIAVSPRGKRKILFISPTVPGKTHDKKLAEMTLPHIKAPPNITIVTDLGYIGLKDSLPYGIKHAHPIKKQRNTELTEGEKRTNRQISFVRVRVEHPFAYIKHFNIARHDYRNRLSTAHKPMEVLASLYNFTRQ